MTEPRPHLPLARLTPTARTRCRRPAAVATLALVGSLAFASLLAAPAGAGPSQDPSATTAPVSLDPTSTAVGPSTTAIGPTTSPSGTTPAETSSTTRVADENRKIWLVVAGLVAVALCLTLLTVRYWRQTRPVARADVEPSPAPVEPTRERRSRRKEAGRHSRRAVAGADHVAADDVWEPRGTGEHDRIEVPVADRTARPDREQRAAAFRDLDR